RQLVRQNVLRTARATRSAVRKAAPSFSNPEGRPSLPARTSRNWRRLKPSKRRPTTANGRRTSACKSNWRSLGRRARNLVQFCVTDCHQSVSHKLFDQFQQVMTKHFTLHLVLREQGFVRCLDGTFRRKDLPHARTYLVEAKIALARKI